MRKFILLFAAAALSSLGMTAQQLNGTFDGTWVDCYPNNGTTAVGTQPEGWNVSNVFQVKPFILVTPDADRTGNEAGRHSVKMVNTWCGVKLGIFINAGATAPAYMTLGNTWSYGDMDDQSINGESDGGAYGGMDFAYRPDAVSLWVKRLHSTAGSTSNKNSQINKEERASVIFYSWKGSTTSDVKTGLGSQAAPIDPIKMKDREKDVLGKRTPDSKTEDFELISSMEQYIEGDIDNWTQMVYDINYLSESTPEKVNLIISSSDFFDRAKMGEGNQLWVDDVDFVYYSTLTGLEVGGAAVPDFAADKYAYNMGIVTALPTAESISAVAKSPRANVEVTVDEAAWQVRIVVTNQGGKDLDGETSHTYTLQYEKPETEYAGYLNINMAGMPLTYNADATVGIVDYKDGTCDFILHNFTLNMGGLQLELGDITVPEATMTEDASGVKTFEGMVPEMSLMDGEIKARVELNGTIDAEGKANFDVDVTWFDGDSEIPIAVTFSSDMVGEELGGYYYIVENGDYENPVVEQRPVTLLSAQVTRTDKPALPPYTLVLKDVTFKNATADIVVEGIGMEEANPAVTYSGTATNVALPDGTVAETVAVKGGTTDGDHYEIKFTVTVGGSESVIGFTTEPVTSGVDSVAAGEVAVYGADGAIVVDGFDGEVAVYAADGRLVKSAAVDGHAEIAVAGGLYVVRAGEAVKKVIVK